MPLFAAFFSALFQALGVFLLRLFVAKLGLRVAGYATLVALSVSFVAAFNGFIAPLVSTMFNTQYGQFIGLAFPPIAGTCIATLVSAMGAVYAYRLKVRLVSVTTGL